MSPGLGTQASGPLGVLKRGSKRGSQRDRVVVGHRDHPRQGLR